MKPVYSEDATKPIIDIIESMEKEKLNSGQSWILERKLELIQKMKEDTDNREYPIMFYMIIGFVLALSAYHVIFNQSYYLIAMIVVALGYYFFVSRKLKKAILKLQADKEDIDDYMHDGYFIKDIRLAAVKLAYLLFFPVICFLAYRMIEDTSQTLPLWQYFVPAVIISSLAWFMFFSDDQGHLDALELEMKGLIALSENP